MPVRATKRGAARVPFPTGADADVLICGASFAGLTVARELRATGARVLVLDRYEIGERQTSACAAPTEWLRNLGLEASIRQTFDSLLVHTPAVERARWPLPFTLLDVRLPRSCARCCSSRRGDAEFETAKVIERTGSTVRTDRGDVTRAADRRCTRLAAGARAGRQRPAAGRRRSRAAWRCIRPASAHDLELWIDPRYVDAGYGWSFPARDELRIGVGSFDPHDPVKQPTLRLVEDVDAAPRRLPGQLDPAPASGRRPRTACSSPATAPGHCLPLTAEGIRHGVLLRDRARARAARGARGPPGPRGGAEALRRASARAHRWKYEAIYARPAVDPAPARAPAGHADADLHAPRVSDWAFRHYLEIAPPQFAVPAPPASPCGARRRRRASRRMADARERRVSLPTRTRLR